MSDHQHERRERQEPEPDLDDDATPAAPSRVPSPRGHRDPDMEALTDDATAAEESTNAGDERGRPYGNRAVERTVIILNTLKTTLHGMSLAEISHVVDMAKPTVFRYLHALEEYDYVQRDTDKRYHLGPGFTGRKTAELNVILERIRAVLDD
jgi:hypothetical protein